MQQNKDKKVMRVDPEFYEWVELIIEEFEKKRGFRPTHADVTVNIKRQFQGFFQV
jgi:DNA replication initiation complex subunit (GINS family)